MIKNALNSITNSTIRRIVYKLDTASNATCRDCIGTWAQDGGWAAEQKVFPFDGPDGSVWQSLGAAARQAVLDDHTAIQRRNEANGLAWLRDDYTGWERNTYTFLPQHDNNKYALGNPKVLEHQEAGLAFETYEVYKTNQHAVPDYALLGQWTSPQWRCVPHTSFCHRVYHVKEYQKRVTRTEVTLPAGESNFDNVAALTGMDYNQWSSHENGIFSLDVDTHDLTFTGSETTGFTQTVGGGALTQEAYPLRDEEVYAMRWTQVVDENVYRMADGEGGTCRDCLGNFDHHSFGAAQLLWPEDPAEQVCKPSLVGGADICWMKKSGWMINTYRTENKTWQVYQAYTHCRYQIIYINSNLSH